MIKGVQDFYYNVTDMQKATEFYSKVLGMKIINQDPHWSSLDCFGIGIGLHWLETDKLPELAQDNHGAKSGGTLTLKSDNISVDKINLEKAGATIVSDTDNPWGRVLVFKDLDGNILKLMDPK